MTIKEENEQINDAPGTEQASDAGQGQGGEDDTSTEVEGDDSHLHDDQKSRTLKTGDAAGGGDASGAGNILGGVQPDHDAGGDVERRDT